MNFFTQSILLSCVAKNELSGLALLFMAGWLYKVTKPEKLIDPFNAKNPRSDKNPHYICWHKKTLCLTKE